MTLIGPINGAFGAAPTGNAAPGAREAATGAIGEIGHRVLAWVGASGGTADRAAWSAGTGAVSDFRADAGALARGGDVYGLGDLGDRLVQQFGGTPAQEGELRRSLESFTREAVIQVAGLSGSGGDRQLAGIRDALGAADGVSGEGGIEGVTERLDAATASLARQNGR